MRDRRVLAFGCGVAILLSAACGQSVDLPYEEDFDFAWGSSWESKDETKHASNWQVEDGVFRQSADVGSLPQDDAFDGIHGQRRPSQSPGPRSGVSLPGSPCIDRPMRTIRTTKAAKPKAKPARSSNGAFPRARTIR